MKHFAFTLLAIVLTTISISSCSVSYQKLPTTDTICISNELDGSLTIRVWGVGRNLTDATVQARKNAVNEVIFNGIRNGNTTYTQTPLVSEANARAKYARYFDAFFSDRGDFDKYVSKADSKAFSKRMKVGRVQSAVCVTLRVYRPELEMRLRQDGIIR